MPGMWKVLEEFVLCYKTQTKLPYTVSALRQEIGMMPLSRKKKCKLKMSSVIISCHLFSCSLLLLDTGISKERNELGTNIWGAVSFLFPIVFLGNTDSHFIHTRSNSGTIESISGISYKDQR